MLRITQCKGAAGAVAYFDKGLSKSDYYSDHGETLGKWHGEAAKMLGLSGDVTREEFKALAENINPETGERLTKYNNENRTVGYDFTFSVPKSVSITHALTSDPSILDAVDAARKSTLDVIEQNMQTRLRAGGQNSDHNTGNLISATFTHDDARPVNGIPDPHLHQHVFIFNATFDKQEQNWKAGQFRNLKANGQYYETLFNSHLASNLVESGYSIERNRRDFELAGFERSTIEKFSNRTRQVEQAAKEKGVTNTKDKSELGARTRAKKDTSYSMDELRQQWRSRLTDDEKRLISSAKISSKNTGEKKETVAQSLDKALSHALERKSVVSEKELTILALKNSYGVADPQAVKEQLAKKSELIKAKQDGETQYTTKQAVKEEKILVAAARSGRGEHQPVNPTYQPTNELLDEDQRGAVKHALSSKDFITVIAGRAGTGKTWSMKEVKKGVEDAGQHFGAFAPSSSASRDVQRSDGFNNATTVADLIQNEKLQAQQKGGVIWIDEAGLLGNKSMNKLVAIAKQQDARLLLTGDTAQHNSVERGDALRVLEKYGGIKPARIKNIKRQKPTDYRAAVQSISNGEMIDGYSKLDKMGAITETEDFGELKTRVAKEYAASIKNGDQTLVVATTHNQGRAVTSAIRDELKATKQLGKKDTEVSTLRPLGLTEAQKQDVAMYEAGQVLQFHQNAAGGFKRGSRHEVVGRDERGQVLIKNTEKDQGKTRLLSLDLATRYSVYEQDKLQLAKGDKLRITQNGFTDERRRLNNGDLLTVKGIDKQGRINATNGRNSFRLPKDYGHVTHGYYTTSPASQGKSVNRVIMVQTAASGKASSKQQFYVSASRGKFGISIHTDDKQALLKNIQRSSERQTATELQKRSNSAKSASGVKQKLTKFGLIARANASRFATAAKEWQNRAILALTTTSKTNAAPRPTKSR